jgi:4'-phosphopantetheinyl transferase
MDRSAVPPLQVGECQVWWASPVAARAQLVDLLDDRERARWARFRWEPARGLYLAAHALARIVLAAHLGVPPHEVRFSTVCRHCGGPHGKPRLRDQTAAIELSISHSGERVVLAVARSALVGVDVEHVVPQRVGSSLTRAVLSDPEQEVLAQLPATDRAAALLRYWTRKEALLKATGDGLAVSPASVTVTAPTEAPELISWTAQPPLDTPVHLDDLNPGIGHVACLAVLGRRLAVVERDANEMLTSLHRAGIDPDGWRHRR